MPVCVGNYWFYEVNIKCIVGDKAVQSMSGRLKSPESHISLSAFMRDIEVWRACRVSMLVEGGL